MILSDPILPITRPGFPRSLYDGAPTPDRHQPVQSAPERHRIPVQLEADCSTVASAKYGSPGSGVDLGVANQLDGGLDG